MLKSAISFSIALVLFAAPMGYAQTTDQGAADPALADIQLGEEVNEELPIGGSYIADQIEDWQVSCIRSGLEFDPCQMYQVLKDQAGNPVAEVSFFNLPAGSGDAVLGGTIVTPLETLLPAQITMRIDSAKAKRYAFTLCAPMGCIARVGFTQAELDAFRKGSKATISIVHALSPDQEIPLAMSLKGFTATHEAVVRANQVAEEAAKKAAAEAPASGN
jgi:invasion protein IalB